MREIVRDPAHVVGLTSFFEIAREPARCARGRSALHRSRDAAALRLPDVRLPPRVLQQPHPVGASQLHAVRRRRLPDLAPRPRRGARRLVARSSRARTSSSRSASTGSCATGAPTTGSRASPTASGVTEGPDTYPQARLAARAVAARDPRDCWDNRGMCFNPRYGKVGTARRAVLPARRRSSRRCSRCSRVATLVVGAVTGLVDWREFAVLTLLVTIANSALTTGALLMLDLHARTYRTLAPRPPARADAARDGRLPADHGVGAGQGDVALPRAATRAGTSSSATHG